MIFPYSKNNNTLNRIILITGTFLFLGICIYGFVFRKYEDYYTNGKKLFEKNEYSDAYKYFLEAARKGNPDAQTDIGYLYEKGLGVRKNLDEALYWYHEAAIRGNLRAKSNYASLLEKQDKYYEAFTWLEEAANEGYIQARFRLGCLYVLGKGVEKNTKKGFELIKEAAEKGSAGAQHLLGTYYQYGLDIPNETGVKINLEEAEKWFIKASSKDYGLSKSAIAYLWAEKGTNLDKAKKLAEEAVEKNPQVGICLDSLGWVLFKQCNYTEAVMKLEKASKLSPDIVFIRTHLAETYLKLGEKEKAKEQWQKALELKPNDKLKEQIQAKLDALESPTPAPH